MCLSPIRLKDNTQVACRSCSICRDNRLNDLIGRCIAEQSTSDKTLAVTLTYAGDVPASVILQYSDVQNMLKRLRRDGYSVRYICAGEYGTKKGRAHWHIVLFFCGKTPDVEIDRRIDWKYWPHGFSYFQTPDYKGFKYVMKYALKDQSGAGSTKALAMSKKPPLGYDFFMQMASDIVDRGLPIHSPEYSFIHVTNRHGLPRRYWLQGRMRELYLERYCDLWFQKYGREAPPSDYIVERYWNPIARREMALDQSGFEKHIDSKRPPEHVDYKTRAFFEDMRVHDDVFRSLIGYLLIDKNTIISAYSDFTAELDIGGEICHLTVAKKETVEGQLQSAGLRNCMSRPVCMWLLDKWSKVKGAAQVM